MTSPSYTADLLPVGTPGTRRSPTLTPVGTAAHLRVGLRAILTEPAHVVRFGPQVHVKSILGRYRKKLVAMFGYLTKYLTKSVGGARRTRRACHARPPRPLPPCYTLNYRSLVLTTVRGMTGLRHPTPYGARHSMTDPGGAN